MYRILREIDMLEKFLRPTFSKLFIQPFATYLIKAPLISPCLISFLGCILGIIASFLIASNNQVIGLIFLALSSYMDILDGSLARLSKKSSDFGTVLDILCDRIVEFAIVLALYCLYGNALLSLWMLGSILICVTSFLVVGIFIDNETHKGFHYSRGLMERPEAFLFFGLMVMFPSIFKVLAILFSILVIATALIRTSQFYYYSKKGPLCSK